MLHDNLVSRQLIQESRTYTREYRNLVNQRLKHELLHSPKAVFFMDKFTKLLIRKPRKHATYSRYDLLKMEHKTNSTKEESNEQKKLIVWNDISA